MNGPVLEFAMRDDGGIEVVSPWFPFVAFDARTLEILERKGWGWREGQALTIRCSNGEARYQLGEFSVMGTTPARLAEAWP